MGRYMPVDCEHGNVADWGDFGNESRPFDGRCDECFTPEENDAANAEFWAMNPHLYTSEGEWIGDREWVN